VTPHLEPSLMSKVGRRLLVQFVLCALLPLGAVAFFSYDHVSQELVGQAHERLHSSCRSGSATLLERLLSLEKDLDLIKHRVGVGDDSLTSAVEDMSFWLEGRFQSVALVREREGLEVAIGRLATPPRLDPRQLEHLRAGKTLVLTHASPGSFARVFMGTLIDPADPGSPLLIAEIRSKMLWDGDAFFGSRTEFFAVDEESGVLFSSAPDATPTAELARALSRDPGLGSFEWKLGGEEQVAGYCSIPLVQRYRASWTISRSQSRAGILATAHYFRKVLLLVAALTFWGVLWLGIRKIRKCLDPIGKLTEATRRIAAKDLNHRVDIRTRDEFEELGQAFNDMADRILERTRELEAASRTKNEFLANMSHEIRTPMTAILGYADLSQDPEIARADLQQYLGIIMSNGEHLLALINDILDVSKIEAGKIQVEPLPCSPGDVIADVVDLMEGSAQARGLKLVVENTGPIPDVIRTDPTRLRQILINLLGNSIKFTEEGEVRLRVFLRAAEEGAAAPLLGFEVRDTGMGMSAEQMARIFEAFTQADASMTRSHGGTGLGLSIVRALARLLGGDITCASKLGEGSTFTVTIDPGPLEGIPHTEHLYVRQPGQEDVAAALPEREAHTRQRVLIAEDVAVNRRLIATILQRAGIQVDEADNGITAYDKAMEAQANGTPYGIIFMDMQMPEMDGYQAVRLLRGEGYDAPIVALTSHTMVGERARCLRAGCDEYATKPIDRSAFLKITFRFLRSGRRRSYRSVR